MEVLFDLDLEAAQLARQLGLPMARAATPGTHPQFVSMITELVAERRGQPVQAAAPGSLSAGPDFCLNDCCRRPASRPPARPGAGQ
jgi:ferrochelatase